MVAKEAIQDVVELGKQVRVARMRTVLRKEEVYLRLMAHRDLMFGLNLGEVKVGEFAKQHRSSLLSKCFRGWKNWLISRDNIVSQKVEEKSI